MSEAHPRSSASSAALSTTAENQRITFAYCADAAAPGSWTFWAIPLPGRHKLRHLRIETTRLYSTQRIAERAARACLRRLGLRARKMKEEG